MRTQYSYTRPNKNMLFTCVAIPILVLGAQACAPTTHVRGNLLEDHQIKGIDTSTATKASLKRKLGTPTTVDPFNDNIWYYIGRRVEEYGVFAPEVKEKRIVRASFNDKGQLVELTDITGKAVDVPVSDRVTPTGGHDNTLLKQFFGNLGRFNTQNPGGGAIDPGL